MISEDDVPPGEEGEKPDEASPQGQLRYRVHEGLLLRMIRRALQTPGKEFVIVVDEINRGDVSRILGPLISTLDSDKRVGAEFPIGIELQYPRAEELESRLFMPSNLHLIGTMNSSDRNIALVDHALRRRFDFIQIRLSPPCCEARQMHNQLIVACFCERSMPGSSICWMQTTALVMATLLAATPTRK